MSNGRILVVEDNRDNMMLVSDILRSLNYEVLQAVDGRRGIDMALAEKPDLILMDLSLPQINGWEATRQIKANPDLKHIPIVALTAHAMVGDRERAFQAGCDDYVTKPINMPDLLSKLHRLLG
jgi:CheY-like chemotaxis protein